mmetsp:Transcript_5788/g.7025  ORF Transcript_5788/g.7025 Transcript_5788/m.7025 type:complete len:304 (+) Transcript_5788:127-1038(+)
MNVSKNSSSGQKLQLLDLPGDLVLFCLEFGDVRMAIAFAQVSGKMKNLVQTKEGNLLWEALLARRFTGYSMLNKSLRPSCFRDEYMSRVSSPRVGDCVEVLWQGKFYSHSLGEHGTMGFEGKAWWQASIVAREPDSSSQVDSAIIPNSPNGRQFYYKAHFPGWEAKWDEWIARTQIRWPKPLDHNSHIEIDVGDHVEVMLESVRVPSVWMEGDVKKVTIDIDGVELFLVTGMKRPRHIWVRRDNLRLLYKKVRDHKEACVPCFPSLFASACSTFSGNARSTPPIQRANIEAAPAGGGRGCATM